MLDASIASSIGPSSSKMIVPSEVRDIDGKLADFPRVTFRIGLLIPMCGSAGLWAPSCISSAQVAVAQLNESNGICGRPVELIMIDSALEAQTPVEEVINSLIEIGAIDAIVGMHISAVRQNLSKIVRQRVPYIYTPLYEGGENTKGIFAIGDTPDRQLGPALEHFCTDMKIKNWALVGNDYVWPRSSNTYATEKLSQMSADICFERYMPFGISDMSGLVAEIAQTNADAVLLSLVGQDAVTFNRAFGAAGMHDRMIRFSCAIEENSLLASGADNLKELYSASSYFGSLATSQNNSFRERYYAIHGETAPVLNALGQSTYEGVQFLAGLMAAHKEDWHQKDSRSTGAISFDSVRCCNRSGQGPGTAPIYLAKADGALFDIIKKL